MDQFPRLWHRVNLNLRRPVFYLHVCDTEWTYTYDVLCFISTSVTPSEPTLTTSCVLSPRLWHRVNLHLRRPVFYLHVCDTEWTYTYDVLCFISTSVTPSEPTLTTSCVLVSTSVTPSEPTLATSCVLSPRLWHRVNLHLRRPVFYLHVCDTEWSYTYDVLCFISTSVTPSEPTLTTSCVLSPRLWHRVILHLRRPVFYLHVCDTEWTYTYDVLCFSFHVCDTEWSYTYDVLCFISTSVTPSEPTLTTSCVLSPRLWHRVILHLRRPVFYLHVCDTEWTYTYDVLCFISTSVTPSDPTLTTSCVLSPRLWHRVNLHLRRPVF